MSVALYPNEESKMLRAEPIPEVVAIKKAEQVPSETPTLLPLVEDAKTELRKTINRFRAK